jgi:uncharacterized protein (DUF2236 family)
MWIAGVRSLYLEALHPVAARGVMQNSRFRQDPTGRLIQTARFVATVTYGTLAQAERAASRVRRIHAALSVFDPDTGEQSPLDRPDLLLWIHCASIASYMDVVRRAGLSISDAMADQYVDEQRRAAELVGLSAADVPKCVGELAEYIASVRPGLRPTKESAQIYDFLSCPPPPAWFSRRTQPAAPIAQAAYRGTAAIVWGPLSRMAYSALPPWAVSLYQHRPYPVAVTTCALRSMRRAALTVPAAVRVAAVRPPAR